MPLYEYRCLKCRETSEILRRVDERDDLLVCPSCLEGECIPVFPSGFSVGSSQDSGMFSAGPLRPDGPSGGGWNFVDNCQFMNCDTGIAVDKTRLALRNVRFSGNRQAVVAKDSDILVDGKIEID